MLGVGGGMRGGGSGGGVDRWTDEQSQTNLPLQLLWSWGHNNALLYKLCPWQAQFMTILSFDLQVWPWPSIYQPTIFVHKESESNKKKKMGGGGGGGGDEGGRVDGRTDEQKSMHKCTSNGPDKLNIWPFWPSFDPCDLNLQPTWKLFQMALFPLQGNNCAQLFLKSMHKCTSYGPDKLNIWLFWPLFDPCDLDLQPAWKNV